MHFGDERRLGGASTSQSHSLMTDAESAYLGWNQPASPTNCDDPYCMPRTRWKSGRRGSPGERRVSECCCYRRVAERSLLRQSITWHALSNRTPWSHCTTLSPYASTKLVNEREKTKTTGLVCLGPRPSPVGESRAWTSTARTRASYPTSAPICGPCRRPDHSR